MAGRQLQFPSYCAYEKKATDGVMLVVMEGCVQRSNDADHSGIVKPEDERSPSYVTFKSAYIAYSQS